VILLRLLWLAVLVCVLLAGLSVLPWPWAASAAVMGVALAVYRLRAGRSLADGAPPSQSSSAGAGSKVEVVAPWGAA
jgi:hypothetical protein